MLQNRCLNTANSSHVVRIYCLPSSVNLTSLCSREEGLRNLRLFMVWGDSPTTQQCIHLRMDSRVIPYKYCGGRKQIYIDGPRGGTGETQDGTANSSPGVMTAGLGRVWEKRKRFWWMTFRVRPLAIANSQPSTPPHRPDASYLLLREKWMNGSLWNKWSLPVWHLQMNPSWKTKSIPLFYCFWRWVERSRLCGCHVHSEQGWFKEIVVAWVILEGSKDEM